MLFNSWLYFVFFATVLVLYTHLRRPAQNALLLVASYVFYAAWDWRFVSLLFASTVIDFWAGNRIHGTNDPILRRRYLLVSCVSNLGILGFFKYFNFFAGSLHGLLIAVGLPVTPSHLSIILPVGISFYTFQTLSYTIDIYRRKLEPSRSLLDFALYVSFFPQLVAGPIERATNLLPQILTNRLMTSSRLREGAWLIAWGLFKKVCVADNLGRFVDENFARSAELNAPAAYLTLVAFAYQIYCDFSGYTDIARGSAKVLGFELMLNFHRPYVATDPQDFWRRWHISLSTWLRDYLYIPVGGSRFGRWLTYRNLMITMVLGGLWHGAAWNFVWWGIYHGALLVGFQAWSQWPGRLRLPRLIAMAVMFQFTLFGWLLFRSTRGEFLNGVWTDRSFSQIVEFLTAPARGFAWGPDSMALLTALALFVLPLLTIEWLMDPDREDRGFLDRPAWVPALVHATIAFFIVRYGVQNADAFIYFQF